MLTMNITRSSFRNQTIHFRFDQSIFTEFGNDIVHSLHSSTFAPEPKNGDSYAIFIFLATLR